MQLWRICKNSYAATAFSGNGSLLVPGRWHDGARMVYTATSIALASVEVFVNINRFAEPLDLVLMEANLPVHLLPEELQDGTLPSAWREEIKLTQAIGMEWFASRRSVALRVPSAAVMGDWNVLLNPEHPDFAQITMANPQPFRFDTRMFRDA